MLKHGLYFVLLEEENFGVEVLAMEFILSNVKWIRVAGLMGQEKLLACSV